MANFNIINRFRSLPIKTRRLLGLGIIVALVVALPLFIWAIINQRFLFAPHAATGEPGTIPLYISESFTGPGALDSSKWNWSGSVGSSVSIFNNSLQVSVPAGHDSVGGNDAVVQALVSSQIPQIAGDFTVSVDLVSLNTTNGYEELKFAPNAAISIRRLKTVNGESLEVWTSPNNSDFTKNSSIDLPANTGSVTVKLVRIGAGLQAYYDLGSGFVQLANIGMNGLDGTGALPRLVVENVGTDFPATTGYFDNYNANAFMFPLPTGSPRPTATPGHCSICGGIANIKCPAGLSCYMGRVIHPDQTGICIDQRGPAYCPSPGPTCQPRPACLDSNPRCLIPEPIGGYCPVPTPKPGGECQSCGGFTGTTCQTGLICKQIGIGIPERPGTCVKRDGTSQCSCVNNVPSISISPRATTVPAGKQVTYTISVTNNDNLRCGRSDFNLAIKSIAQGWVTALSNNILQLAPAQKGTAQVAVTSPTSPAPSPGPYSVTVGVSSTGGAATANATYQVAVNNNPPLCDLTTITPNPTGTGPAPLTVSMMAGGNAGNGVGLKGYRWDFDGNGTWDQSVTDISVTHTYNNVGTYHPIYQVQNNNNIFSAKCKYPFAITVTKAPIVRTFDIKYKLEGVTDDSASQDKQATAAAKLIVKFISPSKLGGKSLSTQPIYTNYDGAGVYRLHFNVNAASLPAGTDYAITLKSEKSVATKFCQATGQSKHCSGNGQITIPATTATALDFDFTGIPLQPGDVFPQDGAVTTLGQGSDLAKLLAVLAKPASSLTAQDLLVGDLDYNGVVNIRDLYLFRLTLQTRYDED